MRKGFLSLVPRISIVLILFITALTLVYHSSAKAVPENPALPQVSVLFSRTEMTAGDGLPCQPNDTNIARLDTTVAPYLSLLGVAATGTLETGKTQQSSQWCSHYGYTRSASWDDTTNLSTAFGWSFVSHSSTYPSLAQWSKMTPAQVYDQTCGSEQLITAHGLNGANGMFVWPDNRIASSAVDNVQTCYDTSRIYGTGLNNSNDVINAPYQVSTNGINGGPCTNKTAACYNYPADPATIRYIKPANMVSKINALLPGQWFSLQFYVLVNGTNPTYTTNNTKWDCTSPNSADHWTNDAERYCFSDFQTIMQAIAAKQAAGQLVTADPATISTVFGRNVSGH
jgi:hypothetical protein